MTREEWLEEMTERLRPDFDGIGFPLSRALKVSCGWPSKRALGKRNRCLGQCFDKSCSQAGVNEIFISPCISDALEVSGTLVHELVHAAVGCKEGHKGPFKRAALAIGLTGRMTATTTGPELSAKLLKYIKSVGPYPHAVLDVTQLKKQSTRMLKLECPGCGYVVRTSAKWLEQGLPLCCCGEEFRTK